MTEPHITQHALTRAIERIPGVSTEAMARVILTSPTVLKAIEFGAPFVKLGTGQIIVLHEACVRTVLPKENHPSARSRSRDHHHQRAQRYG